MRARWLGFAVIGSLFCACASNATQAAVDGSFADAGSDIYGSPVDSAVSSDVPRGIPDAAGADAVPSLTLLFASPTCSGADEIPVPFSDPQSGPHTYGEYRCQTAGALTSSITGDWPDTTSARRPLVFVKVGGTGDGSAPTSPLPTIAAGLTALAAQGNGTLVLSAESHTIGASATIAADISILGVAGRTHVAAGMTSPAFDVVPATGTSASLTLNGIEFDGAVGYAGSMLHASAGSTLVLRDVVIDQAEDAITADAAVIDAVGVTLRNLTGRGVNLGLDGDGRLRSMAIHGGSHGIFAEHARVSASMVGIFGAGIGVAIMSDAAVTASLDRVAVLDSGKLGIALDGSGVVATAQRLIVAGTHYGSTDGAGIGLLVRNHAALSLDPDITNDSMQGRGSQIRGNESTGIVIDDGAHAEMHGLLVGSNGQSGIVIQNSAVVGNIGESFFQDNLGVGLMVSTGGSIAGLLCNGFVSNRGGMMRFGTGGFRMEDGADIEPGAGHRFTMTVANSMFFGHEGYGLLCSGIDATIVGSTFMNNGIGWALFDGNAMPQDNTMSGNRETPPTMFTGEVPGAVTSTLGIR